LNIAFLFSSVNLHFFFALLNANNGDATIATIFTTIIEFKNDFIASPAAS